MRTIRSAVAVTGWLALALLASCAPDLRNDFPFDGALPGVEHLAVTDEGGGVSLVVVDATNKSGSVYVDLDTVAELSADEAFASGAWDLWFRRDKIVANGGSGGPGNVAIAVLLNTPFASLKDAPSTGYLVDGVTSVMNGEQGGWYRYDLGAHRLVTRDDLTYVVRTTTGRYLKLQMDSYYSSSGTPAKVSFRMANLATVLVP